MGIHHPSALGRNNWAGNLSLGRILRVVLLLLFVELVWMAVSNSEQLYLVLPAIVLLNTYVCFVLGLWRKQRSFPLFDVGVFAMTAYMCYSLLPIAGFIASGVRFSPLSSVQLYYYSPSAGDLSHIAWRYVVFIISFALFHYLIRGRTVAKTAIRIPPRSLILGVVVAYLALEMYFQILKYTVNVDVGAAYDAGQMERYQSYMALPLFLRQITNHLVGSFIVVKLGVILLLLAHWQYKWARYIMFAWFGFIVVSSIGALASRTMTVIPFLAFVMLYHRMVRPIPPGLAVILGVSGLVAITLIDTFRGLGNLSVFNVYEAYLDRGTFAFSQVLDVGTLAFSQISEFQTIFAGAYDLYVMKANGVLGVIPWQIYIYELLALIPQQILPFDKVDPQEWYLALSPAPSYMMFNPICQSILGLDWIELILRGAGIGLLFGFIHNWYVRNSENFWASLFYIYVVIFSYYSIRSTTFTFVAFVVFQFIPAMLLVLAIKWIVSNAKVSELEASK